MRWPVCQHARIYAVDMPLQFDMVCPRDVLAAFRKSGPDQLLAIVASARGISEPIGWSLSMVFVGVEHSEGFIETNGEFLAADKPLCGTKLYSRRFSPAKPPYPPGVPAEPFIVASQGAIRRHTPVVCDNWMT